MKVVEQVAGIYFHLEVENDQDRRFLLALDEVWAKNKKFEVLAVVSRKTSSIIDTAEVQFQS